ncbi:MAG: hypothetical protein ACREOH_11685 [Candidatus Entotheonellia bacterium]
MAGGTGFKSLPGSRVMQYSLAPARVWTRNPAIEMERRIRCAS